MKVVLDTNVLFAAFAARGLCEALLAACLQAHEMVLSDHILDELCEHLAGKLKMPERRLREIRRLLRDHAEIVTPAEVPSTACPDPDDLPVLGTAVACQCDALVTGDAQLVALGSIGGIPILTPREFYDRIR